MDLDLLHKVMKINGNHYMINVRNKNKIKNIIISIFEAQKNRESLLI